MASALAALQSQLPLGPLLMPNHLALGNLAGITGQDLNALQQAFQQAQQVTLQQQLQSYMELLHSSATGLGPQKGANSANAQVQAAAQLFQVIHKHNLLTARYIYVSLCQYKFDVCLRNQSKKEMKNETLRLESERKIDVMHIIALHA